MSTPVTSVKGTGYKSVSMPRLSPEQQQLFSQVFGSLSPHLGGAVQGLGKLAAGDEEMFQGLEAPALRQYQKLLGGIGARFSGGGGALGGPGQPGALSAQRSSAFQNALTGSAAELAERLQGQRIGLQQSAIEQLLGLYKNLMSTTPYENSLIPKERKNPWGGILEGASSGALAGSPFGPWGTGIGALVGGTTGYLGGR